MTARRPFPDPGSLARARALVLEAGVSLPIDAWDSLATICDTGWLPSTRLPSASAARLVRRRLGRLASPPLTVAAAARAPRGEDVVHVRGTAAALPGSDAGRPLWGLDTVRDADGTWLVEAASDFLLADGDGGAITVVAAGGHLINGGTLRAGDAVSVFGFFAEIPDCAGLARSAHGRSGLVPALRSGAELPLLVSRVVR